LRSFVRCALALLALALLPGCHNGQVRLEVSPGSNSYVWQDAIAPEQCRSFYQGLFYPPQPAVGYAQGRGQDVERFILNAQVRWNDAVNPLGDLFEKLCERQRNAQITVSELQKRQAQLTDAAVSLAELRTQLDSATDDYRKARKQETENRGAVGSAAAAAMARAHQAMDAASQRVEDIIKKANSIVGALQDPRAEGWIMASALSP
jgi:hypothetical protein